MESTPEEGFKFIPFRLHCPFQAPIQRLIRPLTEDGRRVTLADLLHEFLSVPSQEGKISGFIDRVDLVKFSTTYVDS